MENKRKVLGLVTLLWLIVCVFRYFINCLPLTIAVLVLTAAQISSSIYVTLTDSKEQEERIKKDIWRD